MNFNTSHVNVNPWEVFQIICFQAISIHLMLMLIKVLFMTTVELFVHFNTSHVNVNRTNIERTWLL